MGGLSDGEVAMLLLMTVPGWPRGKLGHQALALLLGLVPDEGLGDPLGRVPVLLPRFVMRLARWSWVLIQVLLPISKKILARNLAGVGAYCLEFACSSCVCVGFLWVHQLPPTVQ